MSGRILVRCPYGSGVLLVGEAPNRKVEGLENAALMRNDLANLANVGWPFEYFRLFARVNVLEFWPGRQPRGKGDLFPLEEARPRARKLRLAFPAFELVVLLGRRVQRAFGYDHAEFFDSKRDGETWGAVAPHPSKVSRWWNDPINVKRAGVFWRGVARAARRTRAK